MRLDLPRAWFEAHANEEPTLECAAGRITPEPFTEEARPDATAPGQSETPIFAFGRLIHLQRRASGLSLEELADRAQIDLGELISLEHGDNILLEPRTVYKLAEVLQLPAQKLFALSGLTRSNDTSIREASLRFAARSEPVERLSGEEQKALKEFVQFLSEK